MPTVDSRKQPLQWEKLWQATNVTSGHGKPMHYGLLSRPYVSSTTSIGTIANALRGRPFIVAQPHAAAQWLVQVYPLVRRVYRRHGLDEGRITAESSLPDPIPSACSWMLGAVAGTDLVTRAASAHEVRRMGT